MTNLDDDFYEEIDESVLPAFVDESAVPIPLNQLQPWHRPRKQFIRERQWKSLTDRLIDDLKSANSPSLRANKLNYLTLPGIDHFDVEILGELAIERGLKLEATGFLSEAEKNSIKARSQFRAETLIKRGVIEDTSITFPYRFEEIATRQSQAYKEISSRAPFHVVNIDACGSIALPSAEHSARIIDALFRVVEIQLSVTRDPWLLFLTTDARDECLSQRVKTALDDAIRQNAVSSTEFRNRTISCLGNEGDDLESALLQAGRNPGKFVTKFSLGLSKWLLHNASDEGWNVKSRPFYCYSTRPHDDCDVSMPCLAFEFKPRPVFLSDRYNAVQDQATQNQNPTDYSIQALGRAEGMLNLDSFFIENEEIRREFTLKQRELLKRAGYQASALAAFDKEYSE